MIGWPLLMLYFALPAPAGAAGAVPLSPALGDEVGFDQRLGVQVPLDLGLADETGNPVRLGDCFRPSPRATTSRWSRSAIETRAKPVILIPTQYRCASLCTLVSNGFIQVLHELPLLPGRDFEVVMVSFDGRETCQTAAAKKKLYLAQYGHREAAGGWHCLTGEEQAIGALAKTIGLRCHYDPRHRDFIHSAGLVILTPDGTVSRYFFGILYSPAEIQKSLADAQAGRTGMSTAQRPRFCFHYDPGAGEHTATVLALARVLAAISLLVVVAMVWFLARKTAARTHPMGANRSADLCPARRVMEAAALQEGTP